MVNKCELSVNRRHSQQAKDADRLEPKWCAIGTGTQDGSGANLIIMDNPRHDPTLFREARTLQRPSFQPSSYYSGRTMVRHLQAELSRRVRPDGGARRHGRTYHRFEMGPALRSRVPTEISIRSQVGS